MVDYSKWKDIEISDDEDDTHPNIDTPSLFRWRHQARLERMEDTKREQKNIEIKKAEILQKIKETKKEVEALEEYQIASDNLNALKKALHDLEQDEQKIHVLENEMKKKEKLAPWNVDTIGQPGFAKTIINSRSLRKDEDNLSDHEKEEKMKQFVKENENKLKEFGLLKKYDDSKRFLQENLNLVCEDTANYLVIWCINLEMEEKHGLMAHVAHQCICMQYILELSKQLNVDPRACVTSFFSRIQIAEIEYKNSFEDELKTFKERIRQRAAEKMNEALREIEEEERNARLGPGGLDPIEVLESLPEALKTCFESQDIPLLQETISSMPEEEARYHMKRCIDSGLWVPDAKIQSEVVNCNK